MSTKEGRISVEEAECSAMIWAIQATWGLGYRTVIFEGDNLHVNQLINGNKTNSRLQHYLETIGQWRHMFTEISFIFTPREQNKCVDTLAKKAISCTQQWRLYNSCPIFLFNDVNNDCELEFLIKL